MKLFLVVPEYYRVKRGQTLCGVAQTFGLPPRTLARENGLTEELFAGQVIRIPPKTGDLYVVRGGESKTLLSGSPQKFEEKNGKHLYIGQSVLL